MRIVLVRHGQPNFDTRRWIGVHEVGQALQQYSNSRVTKRPVNVVRLLDNEVAPHYLVSALLRAQDSLRLCVECKPEVSELLNEAGLPYPTKLIVPLPWSILLCVCRLSWLCGYRSNAPGLHLDVERARQAAELLINRASENTSVFVLGHGVMNRLVVRELKKLGWRIESKTGNGYWGRIVMTMSV